MMWLGFADRIANTIADFQPTNALERDALASSIMDYEALRLLGSVGIAKAARGEVDVASVSIPKLLGAEAEQRVEGLALEASGPDGLVHPATSGPYAHMNLDHYFASWFERYARSFGAPSPAARRRSSATSSPSRCSACPGDRRKPRREIG